MHRAGMPSDSTATVPFFHSSALQASFALQLTIKVIELETVSGTRFHFLAVWTCTKCNVQGLGSSFSEAVIPNTPGVLRLGLDGEGGVPSNFTFPDEGLGA